ncbi:MAG: hypothetical protein AAFQ17_06985, partial [Pseudomonadota bacterium]
MHTHLLALSQSATLAAAPSGAGGFNYLPVIGLVAAILVVFILLLIVVSTLYKRCPSNRILVVYGKVGASKAAVCIHGGGRIVWPLVQAHAYLSLEPLVIDIPLEGALSLNNIRVNVPSTFTVGISTDGVQQTLGRVVHEHPVGRDADGKRAGHVHTDV